MKRGQLFVLVACLIGVVSSVPAYGAIIASTNFDGRTVSGATASGLNWTVNGVADPGSLTAEDVGPLGPTIDPIALFTTAAAAGKFGVDRNIINEGGWYVDIPLNVAGLGMRLSTVSLDAYIFNNDGLLQTVSRDLDVTAALFDASNTELGSETKPNIYSVVSPPSPNQPQNLTFDLSSAPQLAANSNYYVRVIAFSDEVDRGNNAGFDNLVISGTVVPEPATFAVWALLIGIAYLGMSRQRRLVG